MIRLLTDEHIPNALVDALLDRGVDVVRVFDVGLSATPDPVILAWAATQNRVLVTFDQKTVPGFAYARVTNAEPMAGVAVVDEALSLGTMTDELHVLAACGSPDDLGDQVLYIPLGG